MKSQPMVREKNHTAPVAQALACGLSQNYENTAPVAHVAQALACGLSQNYENTAPVAQALEVIP